MFYACIFIVFYKSGKNIFYVFICRLTCNQRRIARDKCVAILRKQSRLTSGVTERTTPPTSG